jgi:hypothetical protein
VFSFLVTLYVGWAAKKLLAANPRFLFVLLHAFLVILFITGVPFRISLRRLATVNDALDHRDYEGSAKNRIQPQKDVH